MDIGKSFAYPFEDEKWLSKLVIGAIVSAIPIVNIIFAGYLVDTIRNVMAGLARPLPEWVEWGEKFVKGLILFLASLVYSLPVICVSVVAFVPIAAVSNAQNNQNMQETLGWLTSGVGIAALCFLTVYGLALSFFLPAVLVNFARKGTFASCFEIGEIVRIFSSNVGQYLTAWVVFLIASIVVSTVVGLVGSLLFFIPCLGWIVAWILGGVAGVYPGLVGAHLFGQAAESSALVPTEPAL